MIEVSFRWMMDGKKCQETGCDTKHQELLQASYRFR
jgi:hypothetical protein